MVRVNQQLPGFTLRYTTDGSGPDARSAVASGPIAAAGDVRVAAFSRAGRQGRASRTEVQQVPK